MHAKIGVFAKHFSRSTPEELFDAIADFGLNCVQFNAACLGIPSLPDTIDKSLWRRTSRVARSAGVEIVALSATFNLLDENRSRLADNFRRLELLAEGAKVLGTDLLTLCSGTRDQRDMWAYHPDNQTFEAWQDMVDAMQQAVNIARIHNVYLGIEPEVANVVSDAKSAVRLISELGSDRLRIVFDPANLYRPPADPRRDGYVITDALSVLDDFVAIAHCQDLANPEVWPPAQHKCENLYQHVAAGTGIIDYHHYLYELERLTPAEVPLILHGLNEEQIPASLSFLHERLNEVDKALDRIKAWSMQPSTGAFLYNE
ncbi:MAG: sugar phosphate isomerase/epimerase, partial [Verrucomicrobia bacterium]|nr:sugar phosphate isomerase/epimerase [Verrucomicrobiota bacterium]